MVPLIGFTGPQAAQIVPPVPPAPPPDEFPTWLTGTVLEVGAGKAFATPAAAVAAHTPGDTISIFPGAYAPPSFPASRSKLFMRSATDVRSAPIDVSFTGTSRLDIDTASVFLWGLDFGNRAVYVNGDNATLMRYKKRESLYILGAYPRVGYCEHTQWLYQGAEFRPSAIGWKFYRAWLHNNDSYGNAGESWRCGAQPPHDLVETRGVADIIRIEDVRFWDSAPGARDANNEIVSIKSSRVKARRHYLHMPSVLVGDSSLLINIRHGNNNWLEAIYVDGAGAGIGIRGYGNTGLNLDVSGTPSNAPHIQLTNGNTTTEDWAKIAAGQGSGNKKYVICEAATIISPKGIVEFGGNFPIAPKGCTIRGPEAGRTYPSGVAVKSDPPYPSGFVAATIPLSAVGYQAAFDGWPEF